MNKTDLITAIMELTDGFKKTHLAGKLKEELETIYESLLATETQNAAPAADDTQEPATADTAPVETADPVEAVQDGELDELEKKLMAVIPQHPEYKNTKSVMVGRDLLKKAAEISGMAVGTARSALRTLRKKGYCTKIRNEGERLNKLSLTPLGVKYLKDNGLLAG